MNICGKIVQSQTIQQHTSKLFSYPFLNSSTTFTATFKKSQALFASCIKVITLRNKKLVKRNVLLASLKVVALERTTTFTTL